MPSTNEFGTLTHFHRYLIGGSWFVSPNLAPEISKHRRRTHGQARGGWGIPQGLGGFAGKNMSKWMDFSIAMFDYLRAHVYSWLVVWNMNFMTFRSVGKNPSHLTHIFQRGRYTTNQIFYLEDDDDVPQEIGAFRAIQWGIIKFSSSFLAISTVLRKSLVDLEIDGSG
jgi:hypothetical protein